MNLCPKLRVLVEPRWSSWSVWTIPTFVVSLRPMSRSPGHYGSRGPDVQVDGWLRLQVEDWHLAKLNVESKWKQNMLKNFGYLCLFLVNMKASRSNCRPKNNELEMVSLAGAAEKGILQDMTKDVQVSGKFGFFHVGFLGWTLGEGDGERER